MPPELRRPRQMSVGASPQPCNRLAELRNAFGAGHGRAAQPDVSPAAARLAASAATGIALFMLAPEV